MKRVLTTTILIVFAFLAQAQNASFTKVAENDCGEPGKQAFHVSGSDYTIPAKIGGTLSDRTTNFGGKIIYAFDKVDINADYQLEVVYLSDNDTRVQQIVIDGNVVQESTPLKKGVVQRHIIDLPRKSFAYGQIVLIIENLTAANNAVVSQINIYSSNPKQLVPFDADRRASLKQSTPYIVDMNVDAEKVIPTYVPIPKSVYGLYKPTISLDGIWQFTEKPNADFYKEDPTLWNTITVPGQWSMQGFKVDSAQCGAYYRSFSIPKDWLSKEVKLRFEGVHSEYEIYLNGKQIGQHEGGMTPYEINITPNIKIGDNQLFLKVRSESTADMLGSLTQYAAHQLGGITRSVTLIALPKVHIADMRVVTDLDQEFEDATLKLFMRVVNNDAKPSQNSSIRISLAGLKEVSVTKLPTIAPNQVWSGWIEMSVKSPLLWDNEHPNLYQMSVELRSSDQIEELVSKKIGFREVEIQGNQMLVNGKAIKLRGVCRHEAHPLTGRSLTTADRRRDAELYRAANCNFIRTSHYPPAEEFLDICDELGLFVEVEAPVCWVGHHANLNWQTLNYRDKKYYNYVLQANMENIQINRNHPSVIFWSMANESYWNQEFAQILEYMKKADPTRPIAFHDQGYGGFNNQGSTAAVANIHYPGPNGYKTVSAWEKPIVYGEYCHLNVYNRSELVTDPGVRSDWALALSPTWDNMYKTKAVLGGSIWSGIDDVFQLPDGNAVGYGEWGPLDGWRRPKPEYWDMKKIYSPIRVRTTAIKSGSPITLDIENRHTFTNLNELNIIWRFGAENGRLLIDLAPSDSTIVDIPIINPTASNELYVSFTNAQGVTIDEYLIPVGEQHQNKIELPPLSETTLTQTPALFTITGSDFLCEIDRKTGQIKTLTRSGIEFISGGPWLMALPLTGGGCFPNHNANTPIFNDICTDWRAQSAVASKQGESVSVKVTGEYAQFKGSYTLTINSNGTLTTTYDFTSKREINPRQWGLVFESPSTFTETFWRRNGLWSVYPSDHISRPTGTAQLFYDGVPQSSNPRTEPQWAWSHDSNQLGSADFRSTRRNIWFAGLTTPAKNKITVISNGAQHWRSWLENGKIKFLIADFVTAGDEMFLSSYYSKYRKPIKKSDRISGTNTILVE